MFSGVYWNQPFYPSVRASVRYVCPCVCLCTNTNFCQSAGGDIKSHLVTALVFSSSAFLDFESFDFNHNID